MASIVIRNLDDGLKSKLRLRAARQGRSMEEEARHILRSALSVNVQGPENLFDAIRRRIAPWVASISTSRRAARRESRRASKTDRRRMI